MLLAVVDVATVDGVVSVDELDASVALTAVGGVAAVVSVDSFVARGTDVVVGTSVDVGGVGVVLLCSPNVFQMDGPTELNHGGLGLDVDDVCVAVISTK